MKFQKSSDTLIIESALRESTVGQLVTYETLSKAIGRDVRQFARAAMASARKTLLGEGRVFGVETNEGLRRLSDNQIISSTEADRKKAMRISGRTLQKLSVVDFAKLDSDSKKQHIVMSAQFGAIRQFSEKRATNRIESKVGERSEQIAIGETLKMFGASE